MTTLSFYANHLQYQYYTQFNNKSSSISFLFVLSLFRKKYLDERVGAAGLADLSAGGVQPQLQVEVR